MQLKTLCIISATAAAAAMAGPFLGTANAAPDAFCSGRHLPITCFVDEPNVQQPETDYPQIDFEPGDRVTIEAGGCVQTGGRGATWKRYVDPAADNDLYHGLIEIPGATAGLVRLQGVVNTTVAVPTGGHLRLGYQDDGFADNGYWGHDNGTGNQCKNVENAWVRLTIS